MIWNSEKFIVEWFDGGIILECYTQNNKTLKYIKSNIKKEIILINSGPKFSVKQVLVAAFKLKLSTWQFALISTWERENGSNKD